MKKDIRYDQSVIEDLAFTSRSSRKSDGKRPEDGDVVCHSSTTLLEIRDAARHSNTEQRQGDRFYGAHFRAAKENG